MRTSLPFPKIQISLPALLPLLVMLFCLNNVVASVPGGDKGIKTSAVAGLKTKRTPVNIKRQNQQGAPTISYTTPHSYYDGKSVSLSPTSSGVAAPAFASTPSVFYSGGTPYGVAADGAGNIYMTLPFANAVMEIPAGGGTPVAIGSGFTSPIGVSVDGIGNVYVADAGNNAVKVISAGGTATVGTGFSSPTGVSVDGNGNVYVADFGNGAVKEILASDGSTVVLASGLNEPYMVATDGSGNIYATEAGNNLVVEIPKGGGTPASIGSGFGNPEGIAVDGSGNVYVCNTQSSVVEMIPAGNGTPVTLGSGFSTPRGLTIDGSGNVYIGDSGNNEVKEIKPVGGYYVSPLLPAGLTINSATGVISGTPTSATSYTGYTVTAYNSSGDASVVVSIQTNILSISYTSPQSYTAGKPISTLSPSETDVVPVGYYNNAVLATGTLFNAPGQLAVDALGNVYVADAGNNRIEKITPAGAAITWASGFNNPMGVAVDGSNNVYVADYGNNAIKEIPAVGGGVVTLLTGLSGPRALAVDGAGNIYFLQQNSNDIGELPAGSGSLIYVSSLFDQPVSIACDPWGGIYVADTGLSYILKIPASGGAPVYVTSVTTPTSVAVDPSGNIYYADHSTNSVYVLTSGSGTPIFVSGAFSNPVGLAVDGSGNVFGADDAGNNVQKIAPQGGYFINTWLPTGLNFNSSTGSISGTTVSASAAANYTVTAYNGFGSNSAVINIKSSLPAVPALSYGPAKTFDINTAITPLAPTTSGVSSSAYSPFAVLVGSGYSQPQAVATDAAGNVYIANYGNSTIQEIPAGSSTPVTLGSVFTPDGMAVDAAGNVYVSDYDDEEIFKIPAGGGTPVVFASGLNGPAGLAFDSSGNLYEADFNSGIIYKFPPGGGSSTTFSSGYSLPNSVAIDAAGNVYVVDDGHNAIKKIAAAGGGVSTIISGTGNGIYDPYGIAVDALGNLFFAQRNINVIDEILHGTSTLVPIGSGFRYPYGVALDPSGNVFVADYNTNTLKEIKPIGGYYLSSTLPTGLSFNNSTGVISGTPTALSAATNYTVTGYNPAGGTAAAISIKVISPDATLSALKLITGTLSPAFASGTTSYTSTVPNATTSISVQASTNFTGATMLLNGNAYPDNSVSDGINLNPGKNTITLVVTAEDGTTQKTYTITVTRTPLTNAALSAMKISAGTLTPAFAGATTSYTASVGNGVTSITVTPTTADPTATVTVNGTAVNSGSASGAIALSVGPNTITTVVTAQDGVTKKTYTVTVTRAQSSNAYLLYLSVQTATLSPGFGFKTFSYTSNVPNSTTSVTVTPSVLDLTATVKVNGTAVANKTASGPIALAVGANTITVLVTAQDAVTKQTYTIVITRAASANDNLSSLKISQGTLNPVFATGTTSYTAGVGNGITSITVTPTTADPTAAVKVDGKAVTSGTASGAIALNVGSNTINVAVTAQNGTTTKTYTIDVTRAYSSNAYLLYLSVQTATLSPTFAYKTFSYTANVPNTTSSVTVTPSVLDLTATPRVNGTIVANKTPSGPIALAVGANTITVSVIAQDGITAQTYTIAITRAAAGADGYGAGISVTQPAETPQLADEGVLVHQGVSPNGDGVNDFLQIDNITNYPDNKLMIMNRNGQLIFETQGYDNSSKVFDGHSNKNGQMQLPGTYFYQLDYTVNGINKHKTGFLVLKY